MRWRPSCWTRPPTPASRPGACRCRPSTARTSRATSPTSRTSATATAGRWWPGCSWRSSWTAGPGPTWTSPARPGPRPTTATWSRARPAPPSGPSCRGWSAAGRAERRPAAVLHDRLLHRLAWEAGRARLRAGAGRRAFTPPPSGPAAALHLTTVSRPPFQAAVGGLGVSAGTVFAQVLPCDATLQTLRADLRGFLERHALAPRRPRSLGHANVLRFAGPVTAAFLAELARQRRRDFGIRTVTEVELVRTDRYLSHEGTTVLARMGLGLRGPGPGSGPS